jgi:hypothetical protein
MRILLPCTRSAPSEWSWSIPNCAKNGPLRLNGILNLSRTMGRHLNQVAHPPKRRWIGVFSSPSTFNPVPLLAVPTSCIPGTSRRSLRVNRVGEESQVTTRSSTSFRCPPWPYKSLLRWTWERSTCRAHFSWAWVPWWIPSSSKWERGDIQTNWVVVVEKMD